MHLSFERGECAEREAERTEFLPAYSEMHYNVIAIVAVFVNRTVRRETLAAIPPFCTT